MRYRPLGSSGLVVSVVGLGCNNLGWKVDLDGTRALLDTASEVGVTLLDTADCYGRPRTMSETLLGEALKGRRDDFVLATKFGLDVEGANGADHGARGSRRYIRRAVEASLRRLQTDYLDLYQYHRPDRLTPIEETVAALQELVHEGKVRYLGHSNLSSWEVADAHWIASTANGPGFVSAQNHWSLLEREAEVDLVPACRRFGVGVLPYFPLANGLLTGKYTRGSQPSDDLRLAASPEYITDDKLDAVERLSAYADDRGLALLDVAIGGLAALPQVGSVIAGARTPEQLRANAAAGEWVPTADDLAELDRVVPAPSPPRGR